MIVPVDPGGCAPPVCVEARTPCADDLAAIVRIVSGLRLDLSNETATQTGLEVGLLDEIDAAAVSREHRLSGADRPDFLLLGKIVLEVKGPRHTETVVRRVMARYASHPRVEGLILATSRAMRMPALIDGKPCVVVNLGRAWL